VLVLTHTNVIQRRVAKFGVTSGVRVATLTSFAFVLAGAYPRIGQIHLPSVPNWSDSADYVTAAHRVARSHNIRDVLAASYTHLLVDEYQDWSAGQHEFVCARSQTPSLRPASLATRCKPSLG
jgi:hypothetical protein